MGVEEEDQMIVKMKSQNQNNNKTTPKNILEKLDALDSSEGEGDASSGNLKPNKTHEHKIHLLSKRTSQSCSPSSPTVSPKGSISPRAIDDKTVDDRAGDANEVMDDGCPTKC